jgi:3-oxo-5alpha-steroid 4-dehydrogenase
MGYVPPIDFGDDRLRHVGDARPSAQDRDFDGPTETYDVVVVGFGGAGACAAITAAEAGASVLVLDRFFGGGSTTQSGGVVYAGGGTRYQRQAGVEDTPEAMFAYLAREVGRAVSEETLQRFCRDSGELLEWLERQGVPFDSSLCPYKTSYPTNRHYLYFSGNEQVAEYAAVAKPAPRGHRTHAKNFSGATFFGALKQSALDRGVVFRSLARVRSLVVEGGAVVGVDFDAPPRGKEPGAWYEKASDVAAKARIYHPPTGRKLTKRLLDRQKQISRPHRALATGGVLLCTGGFSFDRELVERFAPKWARVPPLGTMGDNGAALKLGADVRAARSHLDKMSGWRFISPPTAFMQGAVVGPNGARVGNEQLYGATLATSIVEEHGGHAYLVMDEPTFKLARKQARRQAAFFHAPQLLWLFTRGHVKAPTLEQLAQRFDVDPAGLRRTIDEDNAAIAEGRPDRFRKSEELRHSMDHGPFYGIDCSTRSSPNFPFVFITLGGLVVDEQTGVVQRVDSGDIPGLYAAGRSAVGICSNSYVSGLSLADAVFSGRRAGAHAAMRAQVPLAAERAT